MENDDKVTALPMKLLPKWDAAREEQFTKELKNLINRHSVDNYCETPDFLLAEAVMSYLNDIANLTECRERWFGRAK